MLGASIERHLVIFGDRLAWNIVKSSELSDNQGHWAKSLFELHFHELVESRVTIHNEVQTHQRDKRSDKRLDQSSLGFSPNWDQVGLDNCLRSDKVGANKRRWCVHSDVREIKQDSGTCTLPWNLVVNPGCKCLHEDMVRKRRLRKQLLLDHIHNRY